MAVIKYAKRRGRLECQSIAAKSGEHFLELSFEERLEGAVKLFNSIKKIDGKSCIFDTGALEDGFYYPLLYLKASIVELEGFEVKCGKINLIPKNDAYVRLISGEIEELRRELSGLKETLKIHDEKINGHPIF